MSKISAAITAVGAYVPEYVLTNQILETMVDTNDEWITSRTGIKERRILKDDGKGTSYLAIKAAQDLINKKGIDPKDIELVIVATATPDMKAASTASFTASEIGATNAFSFDMDAACSSFLFGMSVAASYIETGRYKNVLLIGADKMSSIINYKDRATCIIFGDGAGAVLFEPNEENLGLQDEYLRSDGTGREFLQATYGGSSHALTHDILDEGGHYAFQEGRTVFKNAVFNMADAAEKILKRNNLNKDTVDWLAAHQANKRIIDATANRMELAPEKVMINIEKYGNTTSATLPLLINDYESQLKKGDNVIFAAFGGGFNWGSIYLKWAYNSK
ncbi:beta-ketoacyl-ACP synthase III [Algibacter lectus]|uniref:Beta-ketoacyl-[acyl-carrier-protein] synthase III n=1 Tax=Algibacter lectus TaxID=221126 RepID=A0A090V737_9FLAO|nr:beta-ketoacyl-ACP synthase III [Algibacter lectus]MDO7137266.1 beta-ketoacyl-ACP synthase III [Algibacter lectus]MWW24239.1 beta-ketoacyl-ACP synthase III [Algibacter lectus]TDY62257.1 3-oxoacyl-[acyl-carrier-protein] synthase-3 [Algibacter lectus]SFC71534.1 3-oxoacyl-[acyl-carrier-protein] synthase-3 [Algibacter lectus]GAL60720.1 3-oxoacyl-[acyl-carrier-protein] synthase KASIII [Algibacter lectus]